MSTKIEKKNFKSKLHMVCGADSTRPIMQYIYFRDGFAVCTDGSVLVKQHLSLHDFEDNEVEIMNGKFLHKDKFADILRAQHVVINEEEIVCTSKSGVVSYYYFDVVNEDFPTFEGVIPHILEAEAVKNINVSSKLLAKLEKVLIMDSYSKGVYLSFFGCDKGILATTENYGYEMQLAMVMPIMA